jgi:hypothetical protein
MTFTYAEKLAEARREVAMRKNVYPHHVARGKMTQEAADRHLAIMQEIVTDYEKAVKTLAEREAAKEKLA